MHRPPSKPATVRRAQMIL